LIEKLYLGNIEGLKEVTSLPNTIQLYQLKHLDITGMKALKKIKIELPNIEYLDVSDCVALKGEELLEKLGKKKYKAIGEERIEYTLEGE
jgi:hypothetical protein